MASRPYSFDVRHDVPGRTRALKDIDGMDDNAWQETVAAMEGLEWHGPEDVTRCNCDPDPGIEVHAQRVPNAGDLEMLFTFDAGAGKLTFLGASADGRGCVHACREAAAAHP